MQSITNRPEMAAHLLSTLFRFSSIPGKGTDVMKTIQHLSGILVETCFLFQDPEDAYAGCCARLREMIGQDARAGDLHERALPPAHIMDFEIERGRLIARIFCEEWLDCEYQFSDLVHKTVADIFTVWEEDGQPRAESLRLLQECLHRGMAFELAAQELCDILIDRKIAAEGWALADSVTALSAIAGRHVALSSENGLDTLLSRPPARVRGQQNDALDKVVFVMTQEAVRLGVPAGTDWRFGLAANDMPLNAPVSLIEAMAPICVSFFAAISLNGRYDQAVACAKAAGRMIAVAAGGDIPEMEPAIAKPLAMAAITETYRFSCAYPTRIVL